MKLRWFPLFAITFSLGCASTATVSNLDGFWCDLTGTPATYVRPPLPAYLTPAYPHDCFQGDMEVPTATSCLVDDAVCYQLDTGSWCTAGRMPQCPEGAAPLEMDAPCPDGGKCWMYSEGLRCYSV